MVTGTATVTDLLEGHLVLEIECLDRIYLNCYVPKLQVAGQVVGFMTRQLGLPIPSPATWSPNDAWNTSTSSGRRRVPSMPAC